MNRALWIKAIVEARLLLAACMLLLFVFQWIYVWVTSLVKLGPLYTFLTELPEHLTGILGAPIEEVATIEGRIALGYIDPTMVVTAAVWSISFGLDVVGGDLNRGSMAMLLSSPVRRAEVLVAHAAVTVVGAALIALSAVLGTAMGVWTVTLEAEVAAATFLPAATNLFALTFFVCGITTLASSVDSVRWRTVGLIGGFYIVQVIMEVLSRSAPVLSWLKWFTFLGAYEPQSIITRMLDDPAGAWWLAAQFNAVLLGLGLLGYALALALFCRRDVPAPL